MTAALGITIAVLALAILALALRQSGLKTDALDADQKRHAVEKQLQETAREFATYKDRTRQQLGAIRADITELEQDLDQCTTPGARRSRLERLLSKASDREDGGDASGLH